jgi:zinc finger CCCH domain-containing protein 13
MTDMSMNPMGMPGMYAGFGGPGMGMAGMNNMMGMGYGSFNDGWSGQQMGGGEFGANAGYYPSSGYNQQSHQQGQFPNQMHQHQFQKNNFQTQNRFHGQGSYQQRQFGRGYQGAFRENQAQMQDATQDEPANSETAQHQEDDASLHQPTALLPAQQSSDRKSVEPAPAGQESTGDAAAADREDNAANHVSEGPKPDESWNVPEGKTATDGATASVESDETKAPEGQASGAPQTVTEDAIPSAENHMMEKTQPIATFGGDDGAYSMGMYQSSTGPYAHASNHYTGMTDYPTRGRGGMRGGYGRGGFGRGGHSRYGSGGGFGLGAAGIASQQSDVTVLTPGEPRGVGVEGAPTGPRAMREGLPNTGLSGRRIGNPQQTQNPGVAPESDPLTDEARPPSRHRR